MSEFLAYDGEGVDGKYVLLTNNMARLWDSGGLSTDRCLEFLGRDYSHRGRFIRIGFGLDYDVNMWVRDLPDPLLARLFAGDPITWRGFNLQYLPGHLFTVQDLPKTRQTYYDVRGFFGGSFVEACEEWLGEVPPLIADMKARRGTFELKMEDAIVSYNDLECRLLVRMMDRVRATLECLEPPIKLHRWYGPGAAANAVLRTYGVDRDQLGGDAEVIPPGLWDAWGRAYFGGRIELLQLGTFEGPIHRYDLNAAYPAAAEGLWTCGADWQHTQQWMDDPDQVGVWRVKWAMPRGFDREPGPLPFRRNGLVCCPANGEGWYWTPEIVTGGVLWGPSSFKVLEGWVTPYRPAERAREALGALWRGRRDLERHGHPGAGLLKHVAQTLVGKFAQRTGSGLYYCLPWAGWVNSTVRAQLLDATMGHERGVIGYATDGIFSTEPLNVVLGSEPGQWRVETFARGVFLEPGFYALWPEGGGPPRVWTRGHPRASVNLPDLLERLAADGQADIEAERFVGHRLALAFPEAYGARRLQFVRAKVVLAPGRQWKRDYDSGDIASLIEGATPGGRWIHRASGSRMIDGYPGLSEPYDAASEARAGLAPLADDELLPVQS